MRYALSIKELGGDIDKASRFWYHNCYPDFKSERILTTGEMRVSISPQDCRREPYLHLDLAVLPGWPDRRNENAGYGPPGFPPESGPEIFLDLP